MPSCHSTNDLALVKLNEPDTKEGLIVVTDHQEKGRGQRGNLWESERGKNLLMSVVLKPNWLEMKNQFYLNIISSLAVKNTLDRFVHNERIEVKWPNDVLINTKKVAGILIENSLRKNCIEHSVIGIGVNLNQGSFNSEKAASLANFTKQKIHKYDFLCRLSNELEVLYMKLRAHRFKELKKQYLSSLYGYGQLVILKSEFEFQGEIVMVDNSGVLEVKFKNKTLRYNFKEVEFII